MRKTRARAAVVAALALAVPAVVILATLLGRRRRRSQTRKTECETRPLLPLPRALVELTVSHLTNKDLECVTHWWPEHAHCLAVYYDRVQLIHQPHVELEYEWGQTKIAPDADTWVKTRDVPTPRGTLQEVTWTCGGIEQTRIMCDF